MANSLELYYSCAVLYILIYIRHFLLTFLVHFKTVVLYSYVYVFGVFSFNRNKIQIFPCNNQKVF